MRREIKIERAKKLREEGRMTLQEIADRYGVSKSTVMRWTDPGCAQRQRESSLAYKNRNREAVRASQRRRSKETRPSCPDCGQPMGHSSTLCERCRADEVDRRARKIETWWAEGLTLRQIGERLGWTSTHVQVELVRLREKGYDLPYRRAVYATYGKPKHPEQVAA